MVRTLASALIKGENKKYEDAVKTLNTLQTNAQTLEKIRQERDRHAHLNVPNMVKYAGRAGITLDDVDKLNIIHVSGTKGKGSTCAYCESILRHHGYKTGFFSSPHLVEVRERFVVNGNPLDRDKFTEYFWEVYNQLEKSKADHEGKMPNYFGFLTVMAMHVFVQEKVDVAIVEVGIGGQYDSTNIIRKPVVCGVTSLGLDHTSILGNTIDKIAWHKAGIFKPGVPAFTSPQLPEAMTVLSNRAQENGIPLQLCPDISVYEDVPPLGIKGRMQMVNASLALQMCQTWINHHEEKKMDEEKSLHAENPKIARMEHQLQVASPITLTSPYIEGLSQCQWLGRNQKIQEEGLTFYVDGAHTLESVEQCVEWFKEESEKEKADKQAVYKILIFNMTGDRDVEILLKPLQTCDFDAVLFCPNIAYEVAKSEDQMNKNVTKESQLKRCAVYKKAWEQLESTTECAQLNPHTSDSNGQAVIGDQSCLSEGDVVGNGALLHGNSYPGNKTFTMECLCISDCIAWICKQNGIKQDKNGCDIPEQKGAGTNGALNKELSSFVGGSDADPCLKQVIKDAHIQVLVTGSLHLVGGALKVIWDRELLHD